MTNRDWRRDECSDVTRVEQRSISDVTRANSQPSPHVDRQQSRSHSDMAQQLYPQSRSHSDVTEHHVDARADPPQLSTYAILLELRDSLGELSCSSSSPNHSSSSRESERGGHSSGESSATIKVENECAKVGYGIVH